MWAIGSGGSGVRCRGSRAATGRREKGPYPTLVTLFPQDGQSHALGPALPQEAMDALLAQLGCRVQGVGQQRALTQNVCTHVGEVARQLTLTRAGVASDDCREFSALD